MQQLILNTIRNSVLECGRWMRENEGAQTAWEKSSPRDVVTQLDLQIQDYLIGRLSAVFPDATFFSEESENAPISEKLVFIIDPIDGTMNFTKGMHHSCISVACLQHGKPIVGVIYDPFHDELFSAIQGNGAYRNDQPIHVSEAPLDRSLAIFGTAPYNTEMMDETVACFRNLYLLSADLRRTGSAALDLCRVAEGKAALFVEASLSLWDYAAGVLIATEAGAVALNLQGNPLRYDGAKDSIIVGSPTAISALDFERLCSADCQEIETYLNHIRQHGHPVQADALSVPVLDPEALLAYSRSHTDRPGIFYRSKYHTFLVDLVRTKQGEYYLHERLEKSASGNAVVIVPLHEDKYVLLHQFRYAMGEYQWCFPRGFGEPDITPEENAQKETREELNCSMIDAAPLGVTVADSGICGEKVHIVLAHIEAPQITPYYEGIEACLEVTLQELTAMVARGEINDGFTLAAIALLLTSNA